MRGEIDWIGTARGRENADAAGAREVENPESDGATARQTTYLLRGLPMARGGS